MQMATVEVDQSENDAWIRTVRALVAEGLDYDAFTARRMAALSERLRQRKLDQANLRYKYGFKGRRSDLVRRDVQSALRTRRGQT